MGDVVGAYKYIRETLNSKDGSEGVRRWSKQPVFKRIGRPTKITRARTLGYKAKQGFVIVRTRIKKGGRKRSRPRKGRKPRSLGIFFTPSPGRQAIAERRVARKYPNLEVLNSYMVGESGTHKYYEVILLDPSHPSVAKDKGVSWITGQRRRAYRGLTSSAKKSRGLRK